MGSPSIDRTAACLHLIASGVNLRQRGESDKAEKALTAALLLTHGPDAAQNPSESLALRALASYNIVVVLSRGGGHPDVNRVREQARACLERSASDEPLPPRLMPLYQELMANVLVALGEYSRALPYCEASIQHYATANDPVATAETFARAGKCYARMGLRDHAVIPLREAVKVLRTLAGDPRLPVVLLDLGNALRKSQPDEAERLYQEVSEYHVSRGQMESATPAWINLAVMYNERGAYTQALEHYQRALRVREQSPRTPPERIGTVLNNMANTYRRMGWFEEALAYADRARALLGPSGGYSLACALGTRGLILRDSHRDEEAVDWFRKSAAEHQKQPSPNLETLSEELENEAAALERLGRTDEAGEAHRKLDSVRAEMRNVAAVHRESTPETRETEGAVVIELGLGSRVGADCTSLQRKLTEAANFAGAGYYGGRVVIPETTTLMFYGDDDESLFGALEPVLMADPLCAGARITIRNGGRHREVLLPQPVM